MLIKNELKLNKNLSTWAHIQTNELHGIDICDIKDVSLINQFMTSII
jgi:hypothetical protein